MSLAPVLGNPDTFSVDPNTGIPLTDAGVPLFDPATLDPNLYYTGAAPTPFTSDFGAATGATPYLAYNPTMAGGSNAPYTSMMGGYGSLAQLAQNAPTNQQTSTTGNEPDDQSGAIKSQATSGPAAEEPDPDTQKWRDEMRKKYGGGDEKGAPDQPPEGQQGRYPGTWKQPPPGYAVGPQSGANFPPTPQEQQQYNLPKLPPQQGGPGAGPGAMGPVPQGIGGPMGGMSLPQLVEMLQRQAMARRRGLMLPGLFRPGPGMMRPPMRFEGMTGRGPSMQPASAAPRPPGYPGFEGMRGQPRSQNFYNQPPPGSQTAPPGAPASSTLNFIKDKEGWDRGRWDNGQHSTGYGSRAKYPGEQITREEADRRLNAEVTPIYNNLSRSFPNMSQNVKDAMTSFSYNVGTGWMKTNRPLVESLQRGDYPRAANLMQAYVYTHDANGRKVMSWGLVNRRRAEAKMLLQHQSDIWDEHEGLSRSDFQGATVG